MPTAESIAEPTAREAAVASIQREMTAFARRARASSAQLHPELSLVSYALLDRMEERDGCRVTDLADHFSLDKSTVSRQVSALERDGLVERRTLADDRRVQVFHLTPAGATLLGHAAEGRLRAFRQRLADWDEPELTTFAAHLERYNADGGLRPAAGPTAPAPG